MLLSMMFTLLVSALGAHAQTYSATYTPNDTPFNSEQGQSGTNQCGTPGQAASNQSSMCQNAFINGIDDWCLWAPPQPGSVIGETERIVVSWCVKSGYGTRLIPDGAITGAHFVQTPDFVQITGVGNLSLLNILPGDAGGELDPHGQDGNGNPIGGLVFSSAFTNNGQPEQIHEWTSFVSDSSFCFRACKEGPNGPTFCQHIYDVLGCAWNMPANYSSGVFENCDGDSGEPMGIYDGSTFHQGEPATPPPHAAPSSSNCQTTSTIGDGLNAARTSTSSPASTTASARNIASSTSFSGSQATAAASTNAARNGIRAHEWTMYMLAVCVLAAAGI